MLFALVYLLLRHVVPLIAGSSNDQMNTEVELLVVRHQLMVLTRLLHKALPRGHACSVLRRAESGMTFTVHGIHNGNPVQVTWRDGRLAGDPGLVRLFEAYVKAGEPIAVRPDGVVVEADLADPVKAFTTIITYIQVVTALEGDPPPGIDFAAELADLREDQERQAQRERDHARRWWRRLRRVCR